MKGFAQNALVLAAFISMVLLAGCVQPPTSTTPTAPPVITSPNPPAAGEEVTVTGTVTENYLGCYHDEGCFIRIQTNQGEYLVSYDGGLTAQGPSCRYPISTSVKVGDTVEVFAKNLGTQDEITALSTCGSRDYYIRITSQATQTMSIQFDGSNPENPIVWEQYNANFVAIGGTEPYTWRISQGTLPPGLDLQPTQVYCFTTPCPQPQDQASIVGKPTKSGNYAFTIEASDASGNNASQALSIAIQDSPYIQYGSDQGNRSAYQLDCRERGGTFNDCDSACPNAPPGTSCIQICVMSCTIP